MNVVPILQLPLNADLSGFVQLLRRLQVMHRVTEEHGAQVLWVEQARAEEIRRLYEAHPEGDADTQDLPLTAQPDAMLRPGLGEQLRTSKVTALVLLACLIGAGLTSLGENFATMRWLTFLDFRVAGEYIYFIPLDTSLQANQWWRLFTPMLLHFSVLHLAMNAVWYWELGRRIEWRQGPCSLLGLTLVFALVSNGVQYLFSGPTLFGGLSGVLYGLLGHLWIYQRLAPHPLYRMPRGVLVMMLAWLVLCLTGVMSVLGFGAIANGAHVGGLLVGCLSGLLGGALARRKLTA